jgi:hypothetical protein
MKRIGVYYKETVLSLPRAKPIKKSLPLGLGRSRIEKDLFEWKLYLGKMGKNPV